MVFLEFVPESAAIWILIRLAKIDKPGIQTKCHCENNPGNFSIVECASNSAQTTANLDSYPHLEGAKKSLCDHSVKVLLKPQFEKAKRAEQQHQKYKPPNSGDTEIWLNQLSAHHVCQKNRNKGA